MNLNVPERAQPPPQTAVFDLAQYSLEQLRRDEEFVLCRGRRVGLGAASPPSLLLLTPVSEHPSPSSLRSMEHEYSLRTHLDPAYVVRPIALLEPSARTTLVLEDPGGMPLDQLLRSAMEIEQFLRLAIGITSSLGHLHDRGLIHKDVKPANMLVKASTSQVWLMGLGIASRLPRERRSPEAPERIAGTLAYMAPEQTGRMNRSIDSRSDLYALGVTLYEMLTGTLPFTASDPMEWVHCHIARRPVSPVERLQEIPGPVSAIIMKLLAKTAEERYQTAAGVEADLRRCLAQWESQRRIDDFPLCEHDRPDRLLIPEKLYGREREIETLLASFERVVKTGTPELVLVSGYSGIGKSSVVNELHKSLVPVRGIFASGKFDQYKQDVPYSTLAHASQSLIRALLGKNEAELASWRDALREALGPNARLMVDLVPELKLIIGEQPAVEDLAPQDAQRRFQLMFRRFIEVFAQPQHPLALFLDDLQWLDTSTLDLLEDLLTQPDVRNLVLIGAYRDNEVNAEHPLRRKLEAIRIAGAIVNEIILAPLPQKDLTRLIADALQCEPQRVTALAQLIYEKTGGNPFFAIVFVSALAQEGLLTFDHVHARWSWDLERIRVKGYTDNVADLMVARLTRLPSATQRALQQLACLGNLTETMMLSVVLGAPEEQVHADLWEAVRQELVEHVECSYKFIHDRVQEAAYSLIPEALRAEVHLRIGRLLAAQTPEERREEVIFEIVNQLNRGVALITSREERERLAHLNLIAGKRAKAATAYASALTYLTVGAELLAESCGDRLYGLGFALEFHRAECEFLTGDLEAAEPRLCVLWERAANVVDRAAVTCLRVRLYTALNQSDRAVAVVLAYLRNVGVAWGPHPTEEEVAEEFARLWRQLGSRSIEELCDLPAMRDPGWRGTMDVLSEARRPAQFTDERLYRILLGRMANLSLEHGNSDGSCLAYAWLGLAIGPWLGEHRVGRRFGQLSLDLVDKHGLDRFRTRVYLCFGSSTWTRHPDATLGFLQRAVDWAQHTADLTGTAYAYNVVIAQRIVNGDPLGEVQPDAERALVFVQKARFGVLVDQIIGHLRLIRTLRGLTPAFGSFTDAEFDERRFEQHVGSEAGSWYWIRKLQARCYAGDYAGAVAAAREAGGLLWTTQSHFKIADYHFYSALAHAGSCATAAADELPRHLEALAAHHRELAVWAEHAAEHFGNRAALVGAEVARLQGRELEAERLYEEAIRLAREYGFIQNEGIANELAARFYAARGFGQIADLYRRNARHCYLRWGADGKVRQLDQLYPQLRPEEPVPEARRTIGAPLEHLDLATVLKVSQAVSGEMLLEKLIDTLMRTALEQAGGERALLILQTGDEQRVIAEATTSKGGVIVHQREDHMPGPLLPESIVHYVVRTRDSVILDDALVQNPFSADPYLGQRSIRSILCLPLINQASLIGVLYLENSLAPRVFTAARNTVLKLLASLAAVSLENARLYTERKSAEEALRQSETYLAEAQRVSHTGSWVWNPVSGTRFWSQECYWVLGFDPARGLPAFESFLQRVHPDDRARFQEQLERALSDQVEMETEYRMTHPSGGIRHIYVVAHPVVGLAGESADLVGTVIDITERRRAEQRLLAQHRVTQILAQAATLEEATPKILQALCECLDWDVGELWRFDREAGVLRCVEVWHTDAVEGAQFEAETWASTFDPGVGLPGRVWSSRARVFIPDCTQDPAFVRAPAAALAGLRTAIGVPITLAGEVLGVIGLFSRQIRESDHDLLEAKTTIGSQIGQFIERKRAESALHDAQAELTHVTRVMIMGELAASIAHEVNQPLGAMVTSAASCSRWLALQPPDLEKAQRALERIANDGRRAGSIISRIRSLMKRQALQRSRVDLNEAILEVIALTRYEIGKHGIALDARLAQGLPLVQADRVQLQQVILNLIVNAVEAMREVADRPRELTITSGEDSSKAVLIAVRDSGMGMDPASCDKLFEAFYTTKADGIGMGLSISRSIIEAHGGRLWATANKPHGAAFQFSLPVEQPSL